MERSASAEGSPAEEPEVSIEEEIEKAMEEMDEDEDEPYQMDFGLEGPA